MPGLVTDAPAIPRQGTVRAFARGGTTTGGDAAVDGASTWTFAPGFAATAGAEGTSSFAPGLATQGVQGSAAVTPSVAAHVQLLTQERSGVHATATLRYRTLGAELAGPSVDARLALGRTLGPLLLATNAMVGRGLGIRADVDVEAGAAATVQSARGLRVGAEGRIRGELHETFVTAEDVGRPVDIVAGAVAGVAIDANAYVQALGGWAWPRGPFGSGPSAVVAAGFAF